MTQPTVRFYFHPTFIDTNEMPRLEKSMVVSVEVTDSIVKTIEAIRHAGVVQHDVRIWVPSKCYHDPLLMDSLINRKGDGTDALNAIAESNVDSDLNTSIVLQKKAGSRTIEVFFESKMWDGACSRPVDMDSFLDCFQAALSGQPFTDAATISALDGLLINDQSPEPSDLQTFEIDVVRISYSKSRTISVRARNREEAEDMALDIAGNYEYSENEADYEIA